MEQSTFTNEEQRIMRANSVPHAVAKQRILNPKWTREAALTTPVLKGKNKGRKEGV